MVVSDDDGPDFVDEMEAELAARRPVPVQQDEPEAWECDNCGDNDRYPVDQAHCGYRCSGCGRPAPLLDDLPDSTVPVQQEPERPTSALVDDGATVKETPDHLSVQREPGACGQSENIGVMPGGFFADLLSDKQQSAVPSVGLRDRLIELMQEALRFDPHGTESLSEYVREEERLADEILSVLHEAGTQGDWRKDRHISAVCAITSQAHLTAEQMVERIREEVDDWLDSSGAAEAGTQEDGLDALARQFKNGQTVVWGDGPTQQGAVVGFGYTIPERPGGPDRPALVVRERWGERTGHVLPSELDAHAAVSGTPDTKEDEL